MRPTNKVLFWFGMLLVILLLINYCQHTNAQYNEITNRDYIIIECWKAKLPHSTCELMRKQISHESAGTFNNLIRGDGGCSWGFIQFHACIHLGLNLKNARYIAYVFSNDVKIKQKNQERLRLLKYAPYFTKEFQTGWIIREYKKRGLKTQYYGCKKYKSITKEQYCQIRLHNWNGGDNYVWKVLKVTNF